MVEMSSSFTLPPMIRRFGRCGDWEQRMPPPPSSELGESSQSSGEVYRNERRRPSCYRGAETGTERVKSFVNGIVSPFAACWQPSDGSCVPVCTPDHVFQKKPAVVSPHLDRAITYRDSRVENEQDDYSHHPHDLRRSVKNYHPPRHSYDSSPAVSSSSSFPSRVESAVDEADVASDSAGPGTTTKACDKRKRITDIAKPRSDDILCGRGGSSNRHLGNIHFRDLVAANKQIYVGLTKKQKMLIARKIVDAIHNTGGRFLAKDLDTGLFYDIGLPRSLEKTSQALREKHSNEMPVQPVEDEGIETTVESHRSVIKNSISTDGSKHISDDSPAGTPSSSKNSTKSNKNMEAPSLIIPSHLVDKFSQKGTNAHEEDWENNHGHVLSSPSRHYSSEQPYDNHHSPYPPSPYSIPPGSSPSHHHLKSYQPTAGYPPTHSGHHHHRPPYPASPVPSSTQYRPHPHYLYRGHPPLSSPYGRRVRGSDERYAYPTRDDREVYSSEYYSRSTDYERTAPRRSPHGMPPHAQYHRFPVHIPSSRHHGHPVPHSSPQSSSQIGPPPSHSSFGSHASSTPLPQYRPSHRSPQNYYRYKKNGSPPSLPLPLPHDSSPSSRIIYRTANSGYVRCNSDVSPARQRDLKRQRNGDGHTARTSDASLSSAVKKSLSLDERVESTHKEKKKQQQQQQQQQQMHESNSSGANSNRSSHQELISPSMILQSKSCSRSSMMIESGSGSPSEKKKDYSALSGLAALSTAAFLKLDEDKKCDL